MLLTLGNYSDIIRCQWLLLYILVAFAAIMAHAELYEGDDCTIKTMNGKCVLASQCTTLQVAIQRKEILPREIVTCGLGVYEEIVCCPTSMGGNPIDTTTSNGRPDVESVTTRLIERPAVKACQEIESKLNPALTPHILDGTPVSLGEYPHMAAIGYSNIGDEQGPYDFRCGGTLISKRFVLTAAHCVNRVDSQPVIVRMGVTNFTNQEQMRDVVEIPVKDVHIHPQYKGKYNDIALIELANDVEYSLNVFPTCLYTELEPPASNAQLYVTGWGTVNIATRQFSNILLKARLQIAPLDRCNESYVAVGLNRQLSRGVIDTQLCAFDPGTTKDACQGDSGGPLNLVVDESLKNYRIVGIISAGFSCGTEIPGLYTRVSAYLDYIESIVWPKTTT